MSEVELLNLWLTKAIQFLPIRRCVSSSPIHLVKRPVSNFFAKCRRICRSCENPNSGLHRNHRHGRRCATNFLQTVKFYRIQADSALSQTAERIVFAQQVGDTPIGSSAHLHTRFQTFS
uniref:Uncharacterized protein n=1 Tax=Solanum tuberosum TaxID=4113 RepID=M1DQJ4_SOLTU